MDLDDLTEAEIRECIDYANARGQWPAADADRTRHWPAALSGNMAPWSVDARSCAREILLRKKKAAEQALAPWRDVDPAAIARAFRDLPPLTVTVINEPAADSEKVKSQIEETLRSLGLKVNSGTFDVIGYDYVRGADHQHTAPTLNPEHRSAKDVVAAAVPPPPDPTAPHLDAMLRFLLGHPQGERWMGPRLYPQVQRIARQFRPDQRIEHRYTAGMAGTLWGVCEQINPGSTWQFLSREEQQEYLRLYEGLWQAINQLGAAGVRP